MKKKGKKVQEEKKVEETKKDRKLFEEIKRVVDLKACRVRIVQGRHGEMLDIRQYIETDTYEGYTRKGVLMSLEDAKVLTEALAKHFSKAHFDKE